MTTDKSNLLDVVFSTLKWMSSEAPAGSYASKDVFGTQLLKVITRADIAAGVDLCFFRSMEYDVVEDIITVKGKA